MAADDLTYWSNYRAAMQWIKGDRIHPPTAEDDHVEMFDETLQFTIDNEMLDFFRHSQEHRANRKNRQTEEQTELSQIELIPGEQMRPNVALISKLPPVNHSKLRALELDWLYGSAASAKIHSRETHLQMEFDQLFDKKQPAYFPSLPNRLQLDPQIHGRRNCFPTIPISDST